MYMIEAIVTVKPEKAELYEKTFRDLQVYVHANEPGTPYFELCKDLQEPYVYHVFEAYADDAARAEHGESAFYAKTAKVFLECLAGDHMAKAAERGLTGFREIYALADSLKVLVYETI
jgi:quinol monooxygenase YgiN